MSASLNDKITDTRNAARPNSARVTSGRSAGGATLACDNLAGWPTASKVHFVTYKIDSNSDVVAGTQLDCYGIVSGNNLGSFTVVDGTDTGHAVGDVVEMLPTAAWGQDLADALTIGHARTGSHVANLPLTTPVLTTPTIADFTSATHTHANAAGGGQLSGSAIATGSQLADRLLNPYKFSVYLSSAQSTVNNTATRIAFDGLDFDTGSNVDRVTNKGRFTAPIAGFYRFDAAMNLVLNGTANIQLLLYKNGSLVKQLDSISSTGQSNVYGSTLKGGNAIQLAATDYVEVFYLALFVVAITTGSPYTWFSGSLISAT